LRLIPERLLPNRHHHVHDRRDLDDGHGDDHGARPDLCLLPHHRPGHPHPAQ
jgi:hypothetical protein